MAPETTRIDTFMSALRQIGGRDGSILLGDHLTSYGPGSIVFGTENSIVPDEGMSLSDIVLGFGVSGTDVFRLYRQGHYMCVRDGEGDAMDALISSLKTLGSGTIVFGDGVHAYHKNMIGLGCWNDHEGLESRLKDIDRDPLVGTLMVVGCGTGPDDRRDAFILHRDGTMSLP